MRAEAARAKATAASEAERCRALEAAARRLEQELRAAQQAPPARAAGERDPKEVERELLELHAALDERERDARAAAARTRSLEQELESATERVRVFCSLNIVVSVVCLKKSEIPTLQVHCVRCVSILIEFY